MAIAAEIALEANPRITALMCTADVLALSAMDYLRGHGKYAPGQMTVTGFDGVPEAMSRGLTTVAQPSLQKGRRAGELLHKAHITPDASRCSDTELIRGRTAGPAGLSGQLDPEIIPWRCPRCRSAAAPPDPAAC